MLFAPSRYLLVYFPDLNARLGGQRIPWIGDQKLLKLSFGLAGIVEVQAINLAFGDQGGEAVGAAGVFTAEELVLGDGVAQKRFGVNEAPFFGQQNGYRIDACRGFGGGWIVMIDEPVGVEHTLVVPASERRPWLLFQLFAQTFGMLKGRDSAEAEDAFGIALDAQST